MKITKIDVIEVASDIADKNGLNSVSLKSVAEKLNIKTPSLYNHIGGLDDLLRNIAHRGMRIMNERMTQVAIGISGDAAIHAVSIEYFNFIIEHPGIYETIQWATWHSNDETAQILEKYNTILTTLIISCQLRTEKIDEILNLFTGFLHGYTTLQLKYALIDPSKAREKLSIAIDTVMLGIHQKYHL